MAEIHSCQDLSSFHIVIWWSKLGAREPLLYTDRCPQSLKENALKGAEMNVKNHDQS